ncbi:F-box/WD repeat-containing protein 9-like [Macrosteles quadrilineatus]|uniref:F-box/WD repeat-containing protein 9-like n=1 Tax=Macrosteles quadrilineatus TaxID=74068 RepID=UPI0023E2D4D6|nr:F-box/WD repeat-containing protein 9-like [Macrosteles quadrilineatus]
MSDENLVDSEENIYPSLDTIPLEVFLHICSFLDGKELTGSLKYVCKSFYEILTDDSTWRTWLKHRWPDFPTGNLCYKDGDIPSTSLCLHIDRAFTLWSKEESNFSKWSNDTAHISTVDAVKLIQGGRVGISGSRDRSLSVWNTTDKLTLVQNVTGHTGWIWNLAYCTEMHQLFSCSWDTLVKQWSLAEGLTELASYKCKTAVLAAAVRPGLLAAGLFSPEVDIFDPRYGGERVTGYRAHSRSIMALAIVRDYIVSASEDQTLSVYDLTAGKVFKAGIHITKEGHPLNLSYSGGNLLFIGDTMGRLHILDMNHEPFNVVNSFDLGHQSPTGVYTHKSITAMWHDPGFILTGSKDASVRVHTTTNPPRLITRLSSTHGEITAMDFADPVLLVGCANNAVEMWKP